MTAHGPTFAEWVLSGLGAFYTLRWIRRLLSQSVRLGGARATPSLGIQLSFVRTRGGRRPVRTEVRLDLKQGPGAE